MYETPEGHTSTVQKKVSRNLKKNKNKKTAYSSISEHKIKVFLLVSRLYWRYNTFPIEFSTSKFTVNCCFQASKAKFCFAKGT